MDNEYSNNFIAGDISHNRQTGYTEIKGINIPTEELRKVVYQELVRVIESERRWIKKQTSDLAHTLIENEVNSQVSQATKEAKRQLEFNFDNPKSLMMTSIVLFIVSSLLFIVAALTTN